MPFMRSHEARPGTVHPKSELWEESTLLSSGQTFGEDRLSLSPLIYATDACLTSLLAYWLVALSLTFHVNAVLLTFDCYPSELSLVLAHCFLKLFYG